MDASEYADSKEKGIGSAEELAIYAAVAIAVTCHTLTHKPIAASSVRIPDHQVSQPRLTSRQPMD